MKTFQCFALSAAIMLGVCAFTSTEVYAADSASKMASERLQVRTGSKDEVRDLAEYDRTKETVVSTTDYRESDLKALSDIYGIRMNRDQSDFDSIKISWIFNMKTEKYSLKVEALDDRGKPLYNQIFPVKTIINDSGIPDARIDGLSKTMLEMAGASHTDTSEVQNVALKAPAANLKSTATSVFSVQWLAVSRKAIKIKSRSNLKYNKKLEKAGKGVGERKYIYNQEATNHKSHNAGNYKFGFTRFRNVGCEAAAGYNAAILLDKPERLSSTIYYYENHLIEIYPALGYFGSNPLEIGRYLKHKGIKYKKFYKYSKFSKNVSKKRKCVMIMSQWNNPPTRGIHTYAVSKNDREKFESYDFEYERDAVKSDTMSSFLTGTFIVGYILW